MSSSTNLRRWLRRHPHPAKLRVDGRDVAVATGAKMWAVTEETILAMNPQKVEALGADGVCLRAINLAPDDDDDGAAELAGGVAADPTIARDIAFARLIGEAHDAGARRHAEAYSLAFDKLTGLVEILAVRLAGLETAWQRALNQAARSNADAIAASAAAAGGEDPLNTMIQAMIAQQFGAAAAGMNGKAKPAAPNGKPPAPTNGGK